MSGGSTGAAPPQADATVFGASLRDRLDRRPSAVAGILDKKGGLRVVVTQRWRMRNHIAKGERLFVVPDFTVTEPIPVDDVPPLIERVQRYVEAQLQPDNACGTCMMCCILPLIEDVDFAGRPFFKAPGVVCEHCSPGFGCKAYHQRPGSCRGFECWWLQSQRRNERMGPELRPDRCGCYFNVDTQTNDPLIIEVHGTPNADAWRWINEMQAVGYKAKEITHYIGDDGARHEIVE